VCYGVHKARERAEPGAHRSVLLTRFIGLCIPRGARSCRCRGLSADVVVNQRPVATLAAVAAFALLIRALMKEMSAVSPRECSATSWVRRYVGALLCADLPGEGISGSNLVRALLRRMMNRSLFGGGLVDSGELAALRVRLDMIRVRATGSCRVYR